MASSSRDPLEIYNVLRTRNPDELHERLSPLYAVSSFDLPRSKVGFDATLNHCRLEDVGVSFARYGAPVRIRLVNTDFFTQGFGIRGSGEATSDGKVFKVGGGRGGSAGPGATAQLDYRAGLEHIFLRIDPAALHRKLSALLGNPSSRPLTLDGHYDPSALAGQLRLLRFVISELDRGAEALPAVCLAELSQSLIVAYLYANQHNYSESLNAKSLSAAPWQVLRAMEFIEANWDRPLSIETLAEITGVSARSLFATFRKARGCSPMAFVRHVRLRRAREFLSEPGADTTVSAVVSACRFSNPGHFSKLYFDCFGELPSETLSRGRRRKL
jgi:AraC-like DNA-binding protein